MPKCDSCGTVDPRVYRGFSSAECPEPRCVHYTPRASKPAEGAARGNTVAAFIDALSWNLALYNGPATVPAPAAGAPAPWTPAVGDPVRVVPTARRFSDRPGIITHHTPVCLFVEFHAIGTWGVRTDEAEPWEPRVGERVAFRSTKSPAGIVRAQAGGSPDRKTWLVDMDNGNPSVWPTDYWMPEVGP